MILIKYMYIFLQLQDFSTSESQLPLKTWSSWKILPWKRQEFSFLLVCLEKGRSFLFSWFASYGNIFLYVSEVGKYFPIPRINGKRHDQVSKRLHWIDINHLKIYNTVNLTKYMYIFLQLQDFPLQSLSFHWRTDTVGRFCLEKGRSFLFSWFALKKAGVLFTLGLPWKRQEFSFLLVCLIW